MSADIHTCSWHCQRAECIKRQRDLLYARVQEAMDFAGDYMDTKDGPTGEPEANEWMRLAAILEPPQ